MNGRRKVSSRWFGVWQALGDDRQVIAVTSEREPVLDVGDGCRQPAQPAVEILSEEQPAKEKKEYQAQRCRHADTTTIDGDEAKVVAEEVVDIPPPVVSVPADASGLDRLRAATSGVAEVAVGVVGIEPSEGTGEGDAQDEDATGTKDPGRLGDRGFVIDDEGELIEEKNGVVGAVWTWPAGDRRHERFAFQCGGGIEVQGVGVDDVSAFGQLGQDSRVGADGEQARLARGARWWQVAEEPRS